MSKRGKVLRDPYSGPGLLMVEGQQYPFALEGVWRSEVPAKPGLAVDVDFDPGGQIAAITAVPESQLAKEQAELALDAAKKKGGELLGNVVAKFGLPTLIAEGILILSWIWLTAISLEMPMLGKLEFTFWQVLGFLNSTNLLEAMDRNGHPSAGIYGLFACIAMAGPLLPYFWKDKRAALGGVLPLLFMVIVGIAVRSSLQSAFGGGGPDPTGMAKQMQEEAMKAISVGLGIYLSVLASLFFAAIGVKKFLAGKAGEGVYEKPQKVAV